MLAKIKSLLGRVDLHVLWAKLGGRTFVIVGFLAVTGFILAWYNKLTDSYAALAASLSGFHAWRSIKEDDHDRDHHDDK